MDNVRLPLDIAGYSHQDGQNERAPRWIRLAFAAKGKTGSDPFVWRRTTAPVLPAPLCIAQASLLTGQANRQSGSRLRRRNIMDLFESFQPGRRYRRPVDPRRGLPGNSAHRILRLKKGAEPMSRIRLRMIALRSAMRQMLRMPLSSLLNTVGDYFAASFPLACIPCCSTLIRCWASCHSKIRSHGILENYGPPR